MCLVSDSRKISRRTVLCAGLGTAAGLASSRLLAQALETPHCETPAQAEGPFYPIHRQADTDLDLTHIQGHSERALGEIIHVSGQVLDEHCKPLAGALIDVWQANKFGRYHHEDDPSTAPLDPNFQGWGQITTDQRGQYSFKSIFPGAYPASRRWWRPPHIHFKVARKGYRELTTQMYFAGHELNEKDRLLLDVPADERGKLIVEFKQDTSVEGVAFRRGHFDMALQRA